MEKMDGKKKTTKTSNVEKAKADLVAAQQEFAKANGIIEKHKTECKARINSLAEDGGFFCGVVLTKKDILEIVKLAMESEEVVEIPYQLYDIK